MRTHAIALILFLSPPVAGAEAGRAVMTVTGHGVAQRTPDQAVVSLSALAQEKEAARAQQKVNQVMTTATEAIRALGVKPESLATRGITLEPVYRGDEPREGEANEPRIVGYQATNTLEVRLDDPALVGRTIDAAVRGGINRIEGVSFGVKDDGTLRRNALTAAARDARSVAETIAAAMGLRLVAVEEVQENVGNVAPPLLMRQESFAAPGAATPVETGQVRVEATVTLRYRIDSAVR